MSLLHRFWKLGEKLWTPKTRIVEAVRNGIRDSTTIEVLRQNRKGRPYVDRKLTMGPNLVHAWVGRQDGTIEDLGITTNLLTNIGRDVWADWMGGAIPAGGTGSPATAVTATGLTATATPWTASNLATPQLGLAGKRVYASLTGVGTSPVYMNVVSNTTSVIVGDQWWTAADGVGTTPANTNAFIIGAGGIGSVRFMGLSTNASAASAADTTLANEVTTNGLGRALATYAHTYGASTFSLAKTFTASGTVSAVHKLGLFTTLSSAGADPVVFETVLSADATLVSGDTIAVTWTGTLSG